MPAEGLGGAGAGERAAGAGGRDGLAAETNGKQN